MTDHLRRFHFRDAPVRGHWVRLEKIWQDATAHRDYAAPVRGLLGDMLAVTAMVANDIKHDGAVALQSLGSGPVALSFAECRQQSKLRAIARITEESGEPIDSAMSFRDLIGSGRVAISLISSNNETPYQGLVALEAPDLATNVESYFEVSEQLTTRILLANDGTTLTGCLWQRLPAPDGATDVTLDAEDDAWTTVLAMIETIGTDELAALDIEALLQRVFPTHAIYLDNPKPLAFECTCTAERTASALNAMDASEIETILEEDGAVEVTCEFCGITYRYDALELHSMQSGQTPQIH